MEEEMVAGEGAGAAAPKEQGAPSPDAKKIQRDDEETLVTGSRIKRNVRTSPVALQVVDRRQLEYSGANNMSDVLKYMTANSSSAFNGVGGTQPVLGTSQANLRGLGPGATLVLLNGRRIVGSAAGVGNNFVDLATIPVSAVERIEVYKGGASAIYGSDAVAGVINIITRRKFDGLRLEGGQQSTSRMDQHETDLNLTYGATTDKSSLLIGMGYFRRTPLLAKDRDFTKGTNISTFGQPGTYVVNGKFQADPGCANAAASAVKATDPNKGWCTFDRNQWTNLTFAREDRITGFASAEHELTSHTQAFAEMSFATNRSTTVGTQSQPIVQAVYVPADHVDNPFGQEVRFIGRPIGADGKPEPWNFSGDTYRFAMGLRGDFEGIAKDTVAEDWEWESFVTWGRSSYLMSIPDAVQDRFEAALNSCSDPNDLSRCYNPFYSSVDGTGTPNSQAVINGFMGRMTALNQEALTTVDTGITGTLGELPGGDLAFAVGGQYRHNYRTSELDQDANNLRYALLLGSSDAFNSRDVGAGYAELLFPILEGIEVQGAGRFEAYSDVGTSLNPGGSVAWRPSGLLTDLPDALKKLVVKASVASAFRAPALYETFNGSATMLTQFNATTVAGVRSTGNPSLTPEHATALTTGVQWLPVDDLMLEVDLWHYDYRDIIVPENARQIYNADIASSTDAPDPRVVRNAAGELQRVEIRPRNWSSVTTNGLDWTALYRYTIDRYDTGDHSLGFGAMGTFINSFDIPRRDVPDPVLKDGSPAAGASVPDCDAKSCDVAGKRNVNNFAATPKPKLRVNLPLSWTFLEHTVTLVGRYISGYSDDGIWDPKTGDYRRIAAFATLDLQYAYTIDEFIGKKTVVRLGVTNLLDRKPPLVQNTINGYDAYTHDPRGMLLYARLTQVF